MSKAADNDGYLAILNEAEYHLKNGDTLLDLHNSSGDTQPHSVIVKCSFFDGEISSFYKLGLPSRQTELAELYKAYKILKFGVN